MNLENISWYFKFMIKARILKLIPVAFSHCWVLRRNFINPFFCQDGYCARLPDSQLSSDFRLQRREFFHPNSSFLRKLVLICTSLERVISWVTDSDFRSIFEILIVLRQSSVRNHVKGCFLGLLISNVHTEYELQYGWWSIMMNMLC